MGNEWLAKGLKIAEDDLAQVCNIPTLHSPQVQPLGLVESQGQPLVLIHTLFIHPFIHSLLSLSVTSSPPHNFSPAHSPSYYLERGNSPLSIGQGGWLESCLRPPASIAGVTETHTVSYPCLGFELSPSCLQGKHIAAWDISPAYVLPSSTVEAKVKGSVWHTGCCLSTQEGVFSISDCHFHCSLAAADLAGTGIFKGDTTCVYC